MDWLALMNRLADGVTAHSSQLSALHTALLILFLLWCLPDLLESLRRASRLTKALLLGGVVLAGVARALAIPALTRHVFDGHEADYYDVWRGVSSGMGQGYRASDWMHFLYGTLGPLFGGSGEALVILTLILSLFTLILMWMWVRDLSGSDPAGLWAVALLAVDPVHGFWASSAYNVQLPLSMSLLALVALERTIRRPSMPGMALVGVAFGAAVAARSEALLVAIPLLWRALTHLPRLARDRRLLGVSLLTLPAVVWPILSGMRGLSGQSNSAYMQEMFEQQVWMLDYLRPWGEVWAVAGLLVCSALLWRLQPTLRSTLGMLWSIPLVHHLTYALFDDYDFRHTLLPRVALVAIVAMGIVAGKSFALRLPAFAVWNGVLVSLMLGLQDVSHRYYAGPEDFYQHEPRFQTAPYVQLDAYQGCIFIVEDAYYGRYARASHFELYTQRDWARLLERSQGCVLFVYDLENFQASSRSIDGRALKVMKLYSLTLLGKRIDRQAEHYSLIFRVDGRVKGPG